MQEIKRYNLLILNLQSRLHQSISNLPSVMATHLTSPQRDYSLWDMPQ